MLRFRPAQSLLEAILAVGVILTASIGATTLVVTTISSGQTSKDRAAAANLAREASEAIRSMRDSNWLQQSQNTISSITNQVVAWDDNPNGTAANPSLGTAAGMCYSLLFDPSVGFFLSSLNSADCTNTTAELNDASSNVNLTKTMTNGSPSPWFMVDSYCNAGLGCTHTPYHRAILIKSGTETVASIGDISYIDVTTTVVWKGPAAKPYTVTERLYNWR